MTNKKDQDMGILPLHYVQVRMTSKDNDNDRDSEPSAQNDDFLGARQNDEVREAVTAPTHPRTKRMNGAPCRCDIWHTPGGV